MKNIENRTIVLKLNKNFIVTDVSLVSKTICDLVSGTVLALDMNYKLNDDGTPSDTLDYFNPVGWDEWKKLTIRDWDLAIHSKNMAVRVPTVVVTKHYSKVRFKKFSGKPTKEGLGMRDGFTDIYTGEELEPESATIEHILPLSRGGTDTYDNTGLTLKSTNNWKGSRTVEEAGLTLVINPYNPRPIPISSTIRKIRNRDWSHFLIHHK